jgi:hypothetical protein
MRKFLTTLLLVALTSSLFAEIGVKSFRKLENDLDARVNEPLKDQNGDVCAIIKIVTTQTGFSSFDCGQIGVVKTVQKPSEIWVYVPYGAKRITITHPQLGMIRDYFFTVPIEKATVYEMVLITGRVETTVVDEMTNQWLVINPEPSDAMIYVNDVYVKSGMYQAKVKPGTYNYRVELALYQSEVGKIQVTDAKKEVNVKLRPAFGFFTVKTEPEAGAKVILDGKTQIKTTPYQSEALPSGEYTVQVVKEMYQPVTKKVMVYDGQTTALNIVLPPNFAEITVNAPADATIFINNQQKGIATWQGRLNAGSYSFEARRDKHRPAKQDVNIFAGDNKTIELQPTAIFGSLDIMTEPSGASIIIDGKEYGTTPNTVNNLPIGDCSLQLKKSGYATVNKTVIISDGKSTELNETLTKGDADVASQSTTTNIAVISDRAITINSNPTAAKLFIDGVFVGQTPFNTNIGFGNHILHAELGTEKVDKVITIGTSGGETNFTLTFAQKAFVQSLNGALDTKPTIEVDREVSISSNQSGATLYIDNKMVGVTPYTTKLTFGNHVLRIEQNGQKTEKNISVAKTGDDTNYILSLPQIKQAEKKAITPEVKSIAVNPTPSIPELTKKKKFLDYVSPGAQVGSFLAESVGYFDFGIGINIKYSNWIFSETEFNLLQGITNVICIGNFKKKSGLFGELGYTFDPLYLYYTEINALIVGVGYGNFRSNLDFKYLMDSYYGGIFTVSYRLGF